MLAPRPRFFEVGYVALYNRLVSIFPNTQNLIGCYRLPSYAPQIWTSERFRYLRSVRLKQSNFTNT